ncbi:MAG: hypothetical protein ACQET8_22295 [Bacillota bacterium]|uniref:hypothetical protein n=1 Tax=Fictibacillus sp. 18YEL24 TaxID=2745875 RepID=UPI0018CEA439|nr:hypothetical protein [Fictibacillus sp. 18YEL24]MBH0171533.1 hypothetical protein [Fictibacillus sp. 18YEL24]
MKIKLFYFFLFFSVLGLISLEVAGSIKFQYSEARDNFIAQLEISKFSNEDIAGIEASIQDINEKYHTVESISFSKYGETNAQIQNHRNILNEAFTVTEKFEISDYTIIHSYNPDWYFLFPMVFLSISGILLIVWLSIQGKKLYKMSYFLLSNH